MALDHQPATPPAHVYYHSETKPAPTGPLRLPESSRPGQPNVSREKSPPVQQLRSDTQARAMTVSERKSESRRKAATPQTGWTKKDPSGKMPSYKAGTRAPYVKNHLQRREKSGTGESPTQPNWGKIKPQPKPVELISIPKSRLTPDELLATIHEILTLVSAMRAPIIMNEYDVDDNEARIAEYPTEAELAAKIATELAPLEARYNKEIKEGNAKYEAEKKKRAAEDKLWADGIPDRKAAAQLAKDFREFGKHIKELTTPKGKRSPNGSKNGGPNGLAYLETVYANEIALDNQGRREEGAQA